MNISKRILAILEIIFIVTAMEVSVCDARVIAGTSGLRQRAVMIDVVIYNFKDKYVSLVKENLEEIQKQNEGKVVFRFYDGKGNQSTQDEVLSNLVSDSADILMVNLVDTKVTQDVIDRFKSKNIPIIFFNREPLVADVLKSYGKAYYVGTNANEAGEMQGKIIVDIWNKDRKFIDKNNNGVLQYVMLEGEHGSIEARERTEFSIGTINKAGIKTEQLALKAADWQRDLAKTNISSLLLQYGKNIEAIIANNDEMAIGAIEALQSNGYNLGDKNKTIVVVGIDATAEAQELIKKGFMAGSVMQDPYEMAEVSYAIGMNVFEGRDALYGTKYKFDDTKVAIRLPYHEYVA
ncbi:galactose ABC transporter substrate-binding protein [Clostridium beijerinckii]|uniref:D-galactose/methyl-galactoside binding periplasmic protein MglB n=1 Tax=Clostridium beijerinckii TaxID=1520 RepID=A0AB74VCJ4_CLOBE|nr:galactose ABC transporter substrate-binding protein [Clostridium beijerinckii]NRZ28451.1 methyl-galactoside transport system substrate-binding protein [Clostridium beijerinckii]NYB95773.1 methyl-galactoside transport system substrate-binding protein [Clostridium beijerinckii]OOM22228.1 D-galactose-binding periplasmic protein precursor [Clostridium beijerinckii]QUN34156.1 galactose ABC transporter substrate-binding protein [Clostridium beijerinckii]SQB00915.1 D-galactose-binding periplasmic 